MKPKFLKVKHPVLDKGKWDCLGARRNGVAPFLQARAVRKVIACHLHVAGVFILLTSGGKIQKSGEIVVPIQFEYPYDS